jgi:predicted SpoU family rRNA methylase
MAGLVSYGTEHSRTRRVYGTIYITIEESIRERFFDAIEDAINRHGGSISIFDTIDLQMARKP